jgi:hypothetical protein
VCEESCIHLIRIVSSPQLYVQDLCLDKREVEQHTKIERHVKVRAEASPYDPDFKEYFIKREREKMRKKR